MNIKQDWNGHIWADFDPQDLPKVVRVINQMETGRQEAHKAALDANLAAVTDAAASIETSEQT